MFFFIPKTCFSIHFRNYDKPDYGLKKPKNYQKTKIKNQTELNFVFSQILKVNKNT
jgi:hypothetical protein